jgi:hypothetical protein
MWGLRCLWGWSPSAPEYACAYVRTLHTNPTHPTEISTADAGKVACGKRGGFQVDRIGRQMLRQVTSEAELHQMARESAGDYGSGVLSFRIV